MQPFELIQGGGPVLITVPHVGTDLAPGMAERMTPEALRLPDTDWHVDALYLGAMRSGCSMLRAAYSRYVVDLNRPADDAPMYPGQANTGLAPDRSFDGAPLYKAGAAPSEAEIRQRTASYWHPYHNALIAELDRLKSRWGWVVLWDAHSIRSTVPRLFEGRLPDLNFGTFDGKSADGSLAERLMAIAREDGRYTNVLNGRFKGGYTTRHYGRPAERVHAVQLEISQIRYLADEVAGGELSAEKTEALGALIERLVAAAAAWRPGA
jgi:N-formylglutamate deformylase